MKNPSQNTWELIRGLYSGQSFWDTLTGRNDPPLWAFEAIASSDEALAIPHLTSFLLNGRSEVREATARAIGQLLAKVPSPGFVQLDEACRKDWSHESSTSSAWRLLKPTDLKQFWQLPNGAMVVGVASCHGNGFIREAAVNELAKIVDGSELPFLLVRLNDWVSVVRESAATAVLHRVRPDYARHFFQHLRLVLRLRLCGRSQDQQIVNAVTTLLQEPSAAPILREGILSTDRWLRRESFRMAIANKSEYSTALLKEMLSHTDSIIRLWAARNVLVRLNDAELPPVLVGLVQDRFMPVRCEALSALVQRASPMAPQALRDALLDSHSSLRSLARYWIGIQQPEFDFASVYRQSLGESAVKRQRAAILGLGETGKAADAEAVSAFLSAPLVNTRKAAIRALAVLDGDRYVNQFVSALTDEHPGISNEAARALTRKASSMTDELEQLFRTESHLHVRRNVFQLLKRQPFWARGIFLFEALRDTDEHIIRLAQHALDDWLIRSRNVSFAPTRAELGKLRDCLKASAGMLTPHEVREFDFCFKTFE